MRKQEGVYFQYPSPLKITTKKGIFNAKYVNMDQIWEMMMIDGIMQHTHANYLLMMMGGVAISKIKPCDRPTKYIAEKNKYMYLDLVLPKNYDQSIHRFYEYCQHLFTAVTYGHDILLK